MNSNKSVKSKHIDFIILDMLCIVVSLVTAYVIWIDRADDRIYAGFYKIIIFVILGIYLVLMLFN